MSNLKVKDIALVVFLNSLLFVIVNLLTDLVLSLSGQPTISQHVWNQPLLGIPVMLPVVVLPVSLIVHLFCR